MNYHQGDVFLKRVKKIPGNAVEIRKDIVMYGEITGHKHCLVDSILYEYNGKYYLRNTRNNNTMTHNVHPPVKEIEKGDYEVIIQEEYFPEGNKKVLD